MGKTSSSRRSRRPGWRQPCPRQRRNAWPYPALIVRDHRRGDAAGVPHARQPPGHRQRGADHQDHWHEAPGSTSAAKVPGQPVRRRSGTARHPHPRRTGLIHIHPFGSGATGDNVTMVFLDQIGASVHPTTQADAKDRVPARPTVTSATAGRRGGVVRARRRRATSPSSRVHRDRHHRAPLHRGRRRLRAVVQPEGLAPPAAPPLS